MLGDYLELRYLRLLLVDKCGVGLADDGYPGLQGGLLILASRLQLILQNLIETENGTGEYNLTSPPPPRGGKKFSSGKKIQEKREKRRKKKKKKRKGKRGEKRERKEKGKGEKGTRKLKKGGKKRKNCIKR